MKPAGQFKNLVVIKPVVLMSYELRTQIMAFVNGTNHSECQWFHTIERTVNHKGDRAIYTLRHMLIPEQEVTGATVESPDKGMLALWNELKAKYKNEDGSYDKEAVNAIVGSMHAWCHSHVNMAASPSGTDESTFSQWVQNNDKQGLTNPVIMMIVNKKEEVYIRLYDPELGIYCENPDIEVAMPAVDTSYVEDAIKNKVKSKSFTSYQSAGGFQGSTYQGGARVWAGGSPQIGYSQSSGPSGVGAYTPPLVTGPKEPDPKAQTPSNTKVIPTIVRAGRTMLGAETGKLEQDLFDIATLARCTDQAERVTKAVIKALDDSSELYIFTLLLKNEREKILELVATPKTTTIPPVDHLAAEALALIQETWYEHPYAFYATVRIAANIASVSGKAPKRIKEAESLLDELVTIASMYKSPIANSGDRSL